MKRYTKSEKMKQLLLEKTDSNIRVWFYNKKGLYINKTYSISPSSVKRITKHAKRIIEGKIITRFIF